MTRFPNISQVQYLSFHANKIRRIENSAFFYLTALEWLDLSNNKLGLGLALKKEIFRNQFYESPLLKLNRLKWLNLIDNNLHTLKADVFDRLDSLETLLLGRNQFKIIDSNAAEAISSLNRLKVLDLSFMELSTIPKFMLLPPRSLHTLNLTGNLFTILPEALQFTRNLVTLNLNHNPFVRIGGK